MIRTLPRTLHILTKTDRKAVWGYSTSLDLKKCNDKIRDKKDIKDYVYQLTDLIEMKRFGPCHINYFGTGNKSGYSMLQLIETSNITGHFCDEDNSAYLDIFSCKTYDVLELEKFSKKFFQAESFVSVTTPRY
jgi:S-adenosylmethionine/arginine decarboxylase-like enzyme